MSDKTPVEFNEDGLVSYGISLPRHRDDDRETRDAEFVGRITQLAGGGPNVRPDAHRVDRP